jgi:hypothetical protein
MDELIRGKIHDALDVEQPDANLRSRVMASLPVEQPPARQMHSRSLQVGGLVAGLVAVALVAVLLYSRGSLIPNLAHGGGGQCAHLYSSGVSYRPVDRQEGLQLINESTSTCTVKAPEISFIDSSGNQLDVPQDWAPGATGGIATLASMGAAVVPFTIESGPCSTTTLQYVSILATFGPGVEVSIPGAGGLCQGTRVLVSAPIPAVACADGTVVGVLPNSPRPSC